MITILISAAFRGAVLIRGGTYFNVDTQKCGAYWRAALISYLRLSTYQTIVNVTETCVSITNVTETGVSDCHKLITTFMKSYISRLKPKNVHYRSYKNFNEEKFLSEVKEAEFLLKQVIPTRTIQS